MAILKQLINPFNYAKSVCAIPSMPPSGQIGSTSQIPKYHQYSKTESLFLKVFSSCKDGEAQEVTSSLPHMSLPISHYSPL